MRSAAPKINFFNPINVIFLVQSSMQNNSVYQK